MPRPKANPQTAIDRAIARSLAEAGVELVDVAELMRIRPATVRQAVLDASQVLAASSGHIANLLIRACEVAAERGNHSPMIAALRLIGLATPVVQQGQQGPNTSPVLVQVNGSGFSGNHPNPGVEVVMHSPEPLAELDAETITET